LYPLLLLASCLLPRISCLSRVSYLLPRLTFLSSQTPLLMRNMMAALYAPTTEIFTPTPARRRR
jgi:hypothetical protein